jgi:nicotinate-nucleotide pyrophosphorylase (carboxylating)
LVAERVVLNFMQRMSGIATLTAAMAAAAAPARMLETRKTAPGLRLLDKWAVRIGGGENHRMGLYDMVMIKDNHIAAAGGITAAVARTAAYLRDHGLAGTPVEVEAATLDDVREALRSCPGGEAPAEQACVTRIMLDNMDADTMRAAVALVAGRVETEASGNVTLASLPLIATTGVTFVSSGALTHSVTALDISLNMEGEWAKQAGLC